MTIEMLLEIEQASRAATAKTAEDLRLDGASDAALGFDIGSRDAAYLDGYFSELRQRVENGEKLSIRWMPQAVTVNMAAYAGYEDEF